MWRGNSRQYAIWYDEHPVFKMGVSNKVSPKEVKKPSVLNKVGNQITKKVEKILNLGSSLFYF